MSVNSLPLASTLFALAGELEALLNEEAGELNAMEWDDLNEYAVQLRTAANILSGVSVEAYLADLCSWAKVTLTTTKRDVAERRGPSE